MHKHALLPAFAAALLAAFALPGWAATTFVVSVPASTPAGETVYIAGSFQGWNAAAPAHALARQVDGRWSITLDLPAGTAIQYKFTRGSWARVEKGPNGEELANRSLTPSGSQTVDCTVARWADQGTISGHVETFSTPAFLGARTCWVYLPPGYATGTRRYPVLYMHDGQNLFDVRTSFSGEWKVDEACESLIGTGEIDPVIVVGIENSAARCTEYTPWSDPGYACGGGGAAYLEAMRDVLIPAIDAHYRTLPGAQNRWMAGSSLGGLISAYAGFAYAGTWGRIAAVSPSYWWDARAMAAYASAQPRPALQKFYQDMGTAEGGSTLADLREVRDLMLAKGFVEGADFHSLEAAGGTHNEASWAQRVPGILRFLAYPGGTLDAPVSSHAAAPLAMRVGPNPATHGTSVTLSLARASTTRVDVLDVRGTRVRTLSDGLLPAGDHLLRWDGRDAAGTRVSPGLYWVRASLGMIHATRSVIVIR